VTPETEPERARSVIAAEVVPLTRQSVPGLLETLTSVFQGRDKVVRVYYERGEPLLVERLVQPSEEGKLRDDFQMPYELVRHGTQFRVSDRDGPPLDRVCHAAQLLAEEKCAPVGLISRSEAAVNTWVGAGLRASAFLRVPFYEDPEAPPRVLFLCGSKTGRALRDADFSVCVRME